MSLGCSVVHCWSKCRSDKLWTDDHIEWFLEKALKHQTAASSANACTMDGAAAGDLLVLPWSTYDGQFIKLRQKKGNKTLVSEHNHAAEGARLSSAITRLPPR